MGWASGSYLAQELWDATRKYVPVKDHKKLAKKFFELFNQHDADDWDFESHLCKDADLYQDIFDEE